MNFYRFSPIKTGEALLDAIKHIHFESHKLCKKEFENLPESEKEFTHTLQKVK